MRAALFLALWAACDEPPADVAPAPAGTDTAPAGVDTAQDEDTGASVDSTGPATPPWELLEVDCTALSPLPLAYEVLDWMIPSEDFTFDDEGHLVAVAGGHLQRLPFGGPAEILVPNLGDVRGTRFLASGDLVLAHIETQAVLEVDPDDGARQVVASGLTNPNGIAIGADGQVYVAAGPRIVRFDPAVGALEVLVELPGRSFDGISFSPDYTRLYFNEEVGRIHWVDLVDGAAGPVMDGPLLPIGALSILDGMAVDACGNLYVTEMSGVVWRVTPAGEVDVVVDLEEPLAFVPALNFGSGLGGWDAHTLYVSDFKGKLYALEVGVPGKWEPHLPVPAR